MDNNSRKEGEYRQRAHGILVRGDRLERKYCCVARTNAWMDAADVLVRVGGGHLLLWQERGKRRFRNQGINLGKGDFRRTYGRRLSFVRSCSIRIRPSFSLREVEMFAYSGTRGN